METANAAGRQTARSSLATVANVVSAHTEATRQPAIGVAVGARLRTVGIPTARTQPAPGPASSSPLIQTDAEYTLAVDIR